MIAWKPCPEDDFAWPAQDSGLADFIVWSRKRELLPLFDQGDLWLWMRQNPQDFLAALEDYLGMLRVRDSF